MIIQFLNSKINPYSRTIYFLDFGSVIFRDIKTGQTLHIVLPHLFSFLRCYVVNKGAIHKVCNTHTCKQRKALIDKGDSTILNNCHSRMHIIDQQTIISLGFLQFVSCYHIRSNIFNGDVDLIRAFIFIKKFRNGIYI